MQSERLIYASTEHRVPVYIYDALQNAQYSTWPEPMTLIIRLISIQPESGNYNYENWFLMKSNLIKSRVKLQTN